MGRPKKDPAAPPKELPKEPYWLKPVGSKVKVQLVMDGPTDAERREYMKWAVEATGKDHEELEIQFHREAFTAAIRKDKLFQAQKKKGMPAHTASTASTASTE